MKKASFFLTIIIFCITSVMGAENFRIKIYGLSSGKDKKSITFNVQYKGLMENMFKGSAVLIPLEEKVISGYFPDFTLKEKNFLSAEVNLDLNGDGDIKDKYIINWKGETPHFNTFPVQYIMAPRPLRNFTAYSMLDDDKKMKINRIGKKGPAFIIYDFNMRSRHITFGFGSKENPLKMEKHPNPNVQVCLVKTVPNLKTRPSWSVSGGENRYALSNEQFFEDQAGQWVAIAWRTEKLKLEKDGRTDFSFSFANCPPPYIVLVFVNISFGEGVRYRTMPRILKIK